MYLIIVYSFNINLG